MRQGKATNRAWPLALAVLFLSLAVGLPGNAQQTPAAPLIGEPSAPTQMPDGTAPKPPNPIGDATSSSAPQSQAGKGAPKTSPSGAKIASLQDRLATAESGIRSLRQQVSQNARAIQELRMLIESDREAVPRPAEDVPPLNLKCEDDPACQSCMLNGTQDLEGQLRLYEKLRVIYDRAKTYNDNAIMIGDVFSGYHQLEQQAWYATKIDLVNNFKGLQAAYDAKLKEFNDRLKAVFETLDQCTPDVVGDITDSYETVLFLNTIKGAYSR
jgi:hypothetical protein